MRLHYVDESASMLRDFPDNRRPWEILGKPRCRKRIDNRGYEAFVIITPDMVQQFNLSGLTTERNTAADRPDGRFNKKHLKKMTRIIQTNQFVQGHPTICFRDFQGNILDFNHGCQAVMASFQVAVVARFGCPDVVEKAAGTCVPWSQAAFAHRREFDAKTAVAHYRIHFSRDGATTEEIQKWVDDNIEFLELLRSKFPRSSHGLIKPVWKSAGLVLAFVEALWRVKNYSTRYQKNLGDFLETVSTSGIGLCKWAQFFNKNIDRIVSDDKLMVYRRTVSILKRVIAGEAYDPKHRIRTDACWDDNYGARQVMDSIAKQTDKADAKGRRGSTDLLQDFVSNLGIKADNGWAVRALSALQLVYGDRVNEIVRVVDHTQARRLHRAVLEARRCCKMLRPFSDRGMLAFVMRHGGTVEYEQFVSKPGLLRLADKWRLAVTAEGRKSNPPTFDYEWVNKMFSEYMTSITRR